MFAKRLVEKLLVFIVGTLGALVLWSLAKSLRWQRIGLTDERFAQLSLLSDGRRAGVLALWHGHQIMGQWFHGQLRKKAQLPQAWVLISAHRDGRIIARAMSYFHINSIAGSSTRGGKEALLYLQAKLKAEDGFAVITPDGPRGPIYRSKPGVIVIAQRCGVPVFPCAFAYRHCWKLGSWDSMMIPRPFTRAYASIGEPFYVPEDISDDQFRVFQEKFDSHLNKLCQDLEQYVRGQP